MKNVQKARFFSNPPFILTPNSNRVDQSANIIAIYTALEMLNRRNISIRSSEHPLLAWHFLLGVDELLMWTRCNGSSTGDA